jgi:hypothetical protein
VDRRHSAARTPAMCRQFPAVRSEIDYAEIPSNSSDSVIKPGDPPTTSPQYVRTSRP